MGESQTESGKMCISGSEFGYFIRNEIFFRGQLAFIQIDKTILYHFHSSKKNSIIT
jgi:hypothetical protein